MSALQDAAGLRRVSLLLVGAGLLISGYLSYVKVSDATVACVDSGAINCDVVQNSVWSRLAGIDIALLGLLAWLLLGALLTLEGRSHIVRSQGPLLVFGLSLFGFLFSLWLIYVQAGILSAYCLWCLGHELVMTLMFISSAARLRLLLRN